MATGMESDEENLKSIKTLLTPLRTDNNTEVDHALKNPEVTKALVKFGMTLLHFACSTGNVQLAISLLAHRENVNCTSKNGTYPIHLLCSSVENELTAPQILQLLLDNNAIVDVQDSFGRTPLFLACQRDRLRLVELLIKTGCNVNIKNNLNVSPLSNTCNRIAERWYFWYCDIYCNEEYLELTEDHFPSVLICKALLKANANPNGCTILPSAVLCGWENTLKELISLGMDVNCEDATRITPLQIACLYSFIPKTIVKLLLELGADVEKAKSGMRPLLMALQNNSVDKVRILLSYGGKFTREEMSLYYVKLGKEEMVDESERDNMFITFKLLVKAGIVPITNDYFQNYLPNFFNELGYPIYSLKKLCRSCIRSHLSVPIDESADKLPLPNSLKMFLTFEELFS